MTLRPLLDEAAVIHRLQSEDRAGALEELADALCARHAALDRRDVLARLRRREEMGSTAIGRGVAVPHCRHRGLREPAAVLGLSDKGIPFEAADGKPAHVIFALVTPESRPQEGLRVLAAIADLARERRSLVPRLIKASDASGVLEVLRSEEESLHAA